VDLAGVTNTVSSGPDVSAGTETCGRSLYDPDDHTQYESDDDGETENCQKESRGYAHLRSKNGTNRILFVTNQRLRQYRLQAKKNLP